MSELKMNNNLRALEIFYTIYVYAGSTILGDFFLMNSKLRVSHKLINLVCVVLDEDRLCVDKIIILKGLCYVIFLGCLVYMWFAYELGIVMLFS